jgi:hypothetical protein
MYARNIVSVSIVNLADSLRNLRSATRLVSRSYKLVPKEGLAALSHLIYPRRSLGTAPPLASPSSLPDLTKYISLNGGIEVFH